MAPAIARGQPRLWLSVVVLCGVLPTLTVAQQAATALQPQQPPASASADGAGATAAPTLAQLLGPNLQRTKNGQLVNTARALRGKPIVALYFAADWCPPCRQFTPILAKYYQRIQFRRRKFEVVWLSASRTEEGFDEYRKAMPWLTQPFSERDAFNQLRAMYRVESFPTLLFVDGQTGKVIIQNARESVLRDPNGDGFPYMTPAQMAMRTLKGLIKTFVPRLVRQKLKDRFGIDLVELD